MKTQAYGRIDERQGSRLRKRLEERAGGLWLHVGFETVALTLATFVSIDLHPSPGFLFPPSLPPKMLSSTRASQRLRPTAARFFSSTLAAPGPASGSSSRHCAFLFDKLLSLPLPRSSSSFSDYLCISTVLLNCSPRQPGEHGIRPCRASSYSTRKQRSRCWRYLCKASYVLNHLFHLLA